MSKKKVSVGNVSCGEDRLILIAGPCVVEEESTMLRVAEKLNDLRERLSLPIIYKSSFQKDNRSSVENYMGDDMDKALKILSRVKKDFGFPLITDVHYPEQVETVAEVVDCLQIPAYLCMQTTLLTRAARTGRAINVKHGQFLSPENMKYPVAKIESEENTSILVTERGHVFGYNDLIVDPRSFYLLAQMGYPVIFDVTHSIRKYGIPSSDAKGGTREFLGVLSRVGIAAGVDGLFIETHPDPPKAYCDAASQIAIDNLEEFLKPLLEIDKTVRACR